MNPWRLALWIYTLVLLTIFLGAAFFTLRAQAQIIVNGPDGGEKLYTERQVTVIVRALEYRSDKLHAQQMKDAEDEYRRRVDALRARKDCT